MPTTFQLSLLLLTAGLGGIFCGVTLTVVHGNLRRRLIRVRSDRS